MFNISLTLLKVFRKLWCVEIKKTFEIKLLYFHRKIQNNFMKNYHFSNLNVYLPTAVAVIPSYIEAAAVSEGRQTGV